MNEIDNIVKEFLICIGIKNLAEVANMSNVEHNQIYRYFGGDTLPRPKTVKKIADAIGMEFKELFQLITKIYLLRRESIL